MKAIKLVGTGVVPILLVRLTVGLIFLSEGLQKFIFPELNGYGRFADIGFSNPEFWAYLTGIFEVLCGFMVFVGLFSRFAAIPLLVIMIVAFVRTKYPILIDEGFWSMAHAYRTDLAMTVLSIFLLITGSGRLSLDSFFFNRSE